MFEYNAVERKKTMKLVLVGFKYEDTNNKATYTLEGTREALQTHLAQLANASVAPSLQLALPNTGPIAVVIPAHETDTVPAAPRERKPRGQAVAAPTAPTVQPPAPTPAPVVQTPPAAPAASAQAPDDDGEDEEDDFPPSYSALAPEAIPDGVRLAERLRPLLTELQKPVGGGGFGIATVKDAVAWCSANKPSVPMLQRYPTVEAMTDRIRNAAQLLQMPA